MIVWLKVLGIVILLAIVLAIMTRIGVKWLDKF